MLRKACLRSVPASASFAAAAAAFLLSAIAPRIHAADPPLIPREVLFGNPTRVSPALSPDGTRLAYLAPHEGVLNIWVRTIGQQNDMPITFDKGRGILGHFWAPNGDQVLYVQDKDGDENYHVFSVPAAGGEAKDLTPVSGAQVQIAAVERDIPDEILIAVNDRVPQLHDVYRLNLRTGERTLEVQNDFGSMDWGVDHELKVRLAMVPTPDAGFSIQRRDASGWTELLKIDSADVLGTEMRGFAKDNKTFYLITPSGTNAAELRACDIESAEVTTLASDPDYDVQGVMRHPQTYEVQAVAFNKDRVEWKILDPALAPHFEALRQLNPGDFFVVSRDRQDRMWIVAFTQDHGPVMYYAYDTRSKRSEFLFSHRPELEGLALAEMKPVQYTARDGLVVHGYLTLPPGREPKNLPAVLNVHGGPWYRDTWGFHPEAQWLANRGYACLQVNFRGSTGYGKSFVNAGDREWGGKMQNDLSDAVAWLVAEGVADPERIAIYGGSYGGYATLCGVTMTPDLYACGVSMVGPSNLITFIQTIPPYWAPMKAVFDQRVGSVEKDSLFLVERSPLTHVSRIRAPLLIAQGANDPRVNKAESLQIVEALKASGKPVEYLEFPDEGHGFARPENRLKFYAAAERFFAQFLGGRFEE